MAIASEMEAMDRRSRFCPKSRVCAKFKDLLPVMPTYETQHIVLAMDLTQVESFTSQ